MKTRLIPSLVATAAASAEDFHRAHKFETFAVGQWQSCDKSGVLNFGKDFGGGLGVAPVYPQARAHREAGAYVIGVIGFRVESAPGIYVNLADPLNAGLPAGPRQDPFAGLGKISALGIKVSNHCTYHGVSLNVAMDLEPFHRINPCGYAGLATVDLATLGVHVTPESMEV